MPTLFQELRHGDIAPSSVIADFLSDPSLAKVTGDDKTLAILVRGDLMPLHPTPFAVAASKITKHFPAVDEAKALTLPPDPSSITAAKPVPASLWNDRRSTQKRYPRIIRRIAFIGLAVLTLATIFLLFWGLYQTLASWISPVATVPSLTTSGPYPAPVEGQNDHSANTPNGLK